MQFAHGEYQRSLGNLLRSQADIAASLVFQAVCCAVLGDGASRSSIIKRVRTDNKDVTIDWLRLAYPFRCYKHRRSINVLGDYLSEAGLT